MKKVLMTLMAASWAFYAQAQDSTRLLPEGLKISASADVYYKFNFNENITDNKTSFTNSHNSFELGMASVKLEHSFKNVGFVADLGFGKRAEEFSYNDGGSRFAIKQLNVYYSPASFVKFTLGAYGTHVGYELVDAYLNRNYSMSYMFSYGPFFHTGLKADFTFGSHNLMVGVFNPTDLKSASFTNQKYVGAQWGFAPASTPFKVYVNYIGGRDTFKVRNDQFDAVISYQASSKFGIGYNGTVSHYKNGETADWWGSALYLNFDPTESFGLTLRSEYFSDKDGLKVFTDPEKFTEGGSVVAFTLSGNYKIGGFTLVPEFRLDQASEELFSKGDAAKKASANFLLAAIYKF